jgi:hypothetical protein
MKALGLFFVIVFAVTTGKCQEAPFLADGKTVSLTAGVGSFRGTFSADVFQSWKVGHSKKFRISTGIRFTSLLGANLYYVTAPAELTSGSKGPQVIFKENIAANIDSFLIQTPQVNLINLAINLDYQLTQKLTAGFNIDVLGFSFGKKIRGNYINGYEGKMEEARPTSFNLLLISDNDKGSLNSELYLRYDLRKKVGVKAGAQFLFTEYVTKSPVQLLPSQNDRFRNKSLLFCAGLILKLK